MRRGRGFGTGKPKGHSANLGSTFYNIRLLQPRTWKILEKCGWKPFYWLNFTSVAQLCPTLCDPMECSTPGPFPSPMARVYSNSCSLSPWCHPTISSSVIPFSSCFQSFPASGSFQMSQFFASNSQSIGSFRFSISPSNEYSGLVSFRMDCLDLLAGQGTLKSLLQHHSSKASFRPPSAFFTVQLSHSYMTTGKTIALTRRTIADKVMSLLFNMLSRLVITFLPRSKRLNFMAAVTICSDFGAPKNKWLNLFFCK